MPLLPRGHFRQLFNCSLDPDGQIMDIVLYRKPLNQIQIQLISLSYYNIIGIRITIMHSSFSRVEL